MLDENNIQTQNQKGTPAEALAHQNFNLACSLGMRQEREQVAAPVFLLSPWTSCAGTSLISNSKSQMQPTSCLPASCDGNDPRHCLLSTSSCAHVSHGLPVCDLRHSF